MQLKSIIDKIEDILPQTQCRRCHFPGCRPYAEAIAAGQADINQCAPGGAVGLRLIADLLEADSKPLNPLHGIEAPVRVAMIVEEDCIGCAKCILVCPVDAIVGAPKYMHTVIESECTGCELCVPPCPVDCIVFKVVNPGDPRSEGMDTDIRRQVARRAKARYDARNLRMARQKQELDARAERNREALRKFRLSARKEV
jgi:electron transport complex protein RnfB